MIRTLASLRPALLALLAGLMWLAGTAVQAQDYPPVPEGPVYDGADVLSAETEAQLDAELRAYNAQTGRAIIVATVPNLGGASIESYATGLFSTWGVGSAKTNRGVLVLIAPIERKARIEVGCGLETVVTNEAARQIMDDAMLPRFKAGEFDAGTTGAVEALITRIDTANVAGGPVSPFCRAIMKDAA